MVDYYKEKWLDNVDDRFETIVKASQRAREINAGNTQDSAEVPEKVVVKALKEIIQEEHGTIAEEEPTQDKKEDGQAE